MIRNRRRPHRWHLCLFVAALAALGIVRDDPGTVLMRWKGSALTQDVFIRQYVRLASTAPLRDDSLARLDFAHELLTRQILADHATRLGMDRDPSVRTEIERARSIAMARMLVRTKAEEAVGEPDESEIRAAFRRFHTEMELSQIFAPDSATISRHWQELQEGASFDSLARRSMLAAGEPDSSAYMGWVRWNQMGMAAEAAAFALQPDSISSPVRSARGWHVFKALNRKETFFADRSTYQQSRESLKAALIRRSVSEWSESYVDSIMSMQRIRLFAAPLRTMWEAAIQHHADGAGVGIAGPPSMSAQLTDLPLPSSIGPDTPLAELNGQVITARMFAERMPEIPAIVLRQGMRPTIEMMLVDEMMAFMAASEGFASHPEVTLITSLATTSALHRHLMQAYGDTAAGSPATLRRQLLDDIGYRRSDVLVDTAAIMSSLPFGLEP